MIVEKMQKGCVVYPADDSIPTTFAVIKSGWKGWYHVIQEDPENGDLWYKHEFMANDGLVNMFGISTTKRILATMEE